MDVRIIGFPETKVGVVESLGPPELEHDVPPNPYGVVNKVIPAGRCAVARHPGSRERA
jgi:DNA gyrase inhibitor GyrI